MGEYAEVFDMPLEDRAYAIRYGTHKMQIMMLRPEDYTIEPSGIGFVIHTRTIKRFSWFPSKEKAEAFIAKRTTVHDVIPKIYGRECGCGAVKEGWRYANSAGIIFEQCNKCKHPLYQICRLHLDDQVLDSVDLFDLLG